MNEQYFVSKGLLFWCVGYDKIFNEEMEAIFCVSKEKWIWEGYCSTNYRPFLHF